MLPQPPICRVAAIDEIYALRYAVLRPKEVPMKLHFPGDADTPPSTWHFGAFLPHQPDPIGCLTLFASVWEHEPAIQLRGMAVTPQHRGSGVGTLLLQAARTELAAHPLVNAWTWWCNARVEAIRFYERNLWRTTSDEFMIEGVGPHKKMLRLK